MKRPQNWYIAIKGYKNYTRWNLTPAVVPSLVPPLVPLLLQDQETDYSIKKNNITITASRKFGGAISSVKVNDIEFINSYDHGRELQSALNASIKPNATLIPEIYNPTEAGSSLDATKSASTSKIINISTNNNTLTNKTQMAYWLRPGEKSFGNLALNKSPLSNNFLSKNVSFNSNINNVVDYTVRFTVPSNQNGESYYFLQFEVLTGYMSIEFSNFWIFQNNNLVTLSNQEDGEQAYPILFSNGNNDNDMAMGVVVAKRTTYVTTNNQYGNYGRFTFSPDPDQTPNGLPILKWNYVFRIWPAKILANNGIITSGTAPLNETQKDYTFPLYLVICTKSECLIALQNLASKNLI
jgi:hypothetical protein